MPVAVPVNDYPALIAKAEGDVASADAGAQEALAAQAAKQTELEAAAAPRKQDLQTQRDTAAADVQKSLTDGPKVTPLPENKAQHIDPKQLNETASMMMTLAGLAGLMTRRPMVNALTNMTAAMKGLQAGDEEQYQRSYKEFIDNYKKATDQNAANVKEYDRIIKSKEMSLTEKDRAIRDYAKQVGDEVTTNLKSFGDRIKHFDTMRKAGEQAVLKYRTLNEQHDARERDREQRRQHAETIAATKNQNRYTPAGVNDKGEVVMADSHTGQTLTLPGVKPKAGGAAGGAGAAAGQLERITNAMSQAAGAMSNLANLPITTTGPLFSQKDFTGLMTAPLSALNQKISEESSQMMQTRMAGVARNLATLETGGAATGLVGLTDSLQRGVGIQAGAPLYVALDKLAEMRRIVEDSARTALSSKKYTPEQHALIKENLEIVRKVIPFDQGDIDKAVKTGSGKPGAVEGADKSLTFTEFAQKHAIHDRAAPQAGAQSPQDKSALEWATANPADPRSDQIKKRLGM